MMQNSLDRLLDGIRVALRDDVRPLVDDVAAVVRDRAADGHRRVGVAQRWRMRAQQQVAVLLCRLHGFVGLLVLVDHGGRGKDQQQ